MSELEEEDGFLQVHQGHLPKANPNGEEKG